jgi:hypothetical protein
MGGSVTFIDVTLGVFKCHGGLHIGRNSGMGLDLVHLLYSHNLHFLLDSLLLLLHLYRIHRQLLRPPYDLSPYTMEIGATGWDDDIDV